MSRYGYASRGSRVSASALFACMGGLGEERGERGVGEGWGGWRGGEEEEEEERVEVNDISLSLLVVYLFIYLLISFPFLSRRNNPCVPLQMKSPSTPRIPEYIYIRNTIFHLLPTTTY